jgi:hypothetical protein
MKKFDVKEFEEEIKAEFKEFFPLAGDEDSGMRKLIEQMVAMSSRVCAIALSKYHHDFHGEDS